MKSIVFSAPLIIPKCPEQKCPLRAFIKEQDVFYVSANETYLIPHVKCGFKKVAKTLITMRKICAKCASENNVKTR